MVSNPLNGGFRSSTGRLSHGGLGGWVDRHFKILAILPTVILLLGLTVAPAVELVGMAMSQISFENMQEVRVPALLSNIEQLTNDWIYGKALVNTLIFVFVSTSFEMLLGFGLALVVSNVTYAKGVIRTATLLPILIPPVVIGSMWRLMYNPDFGIINDLLAYVGVAPLDLLGSVDTALLSVIIVDVWHWTPFIFLILLAAIEGLPAQVLEAANIDGASYAQKLRFVILPMIWPALMVAFMFRSIMAFKVFDQIFLLTSGGPGTSSEVVSLYVYKVYFQQNRLGYGALLAIVTIAVVCAYLAVFQLAQRRIRRNA